MHCSTFRLINFHSPIAWPHLLPCWVLISNCVATFTFTWMFPSISDTTYPKLNSGSSTLIRFTPQRRTSPFMHILTLVHITLHLLPGAMSHAGDFTSALTLHDLSQSCPISMQDGKDEWAGLWGCPHSDTVQQLNGDHLLLLSAHLQSITVSGSIHSLGPRTFGVV